jgi:hypothetical protein
MKKQYMAFLFHYDGFESGGWGDALHEGRGKKKRARFFETIKEAMQAIKAEASDDGDEFQIMNLNTGRLVRKGTIRGNET